MIITPPADMPEGHGSDTPETDIELMITRLRDRALNYGQKPDPIYGQAADAIKELQRRLREAEAELERRLAKIMRYKQRAEAAQREEKIRELERELKGWRDFSRSTQPAELERMKNAGN